MSLLRAGSCAHSLRRVSSSATLLLVIVIAIACGNGGGDSTSGPRIRTLTIGAYTTPREVYAQEILPGFAAAWGAKTGDTLKFNDSYLASGAQSRAIIAGFAADVAALALEPDIENIAKANLITHDWRAAPLSGVVSRSLVVIAVRPGNPKRILDWSDLGRAGVKVLMPNPATSGGAMWNLAAVYGAAFRGATPAAAGDSAAAERFLGDVLRNVSIMDKGARESILTFEKGVGDAAITYENEVIAARLAGRPMDYVIPRATILIETPAAVVDVFAEQHGTREIARAFLEYLGTREAQQAFANHGFRSVIDSVSPTNPAARLLEPLQTFTIRDLGGWPAVTRALFAPGGVVERARQQTPGRT